MIYLFLWHTVIYWSVCIFFYRKDLHVMRNNMWGKYKYNPQMNTMKELFQTTLQSAKHSAINQCIGLIFVSAVDMSTHTQLSFYDTLMFVVGVQAVNMWFFCVHALLHTKYLFHIHHQHHTNRDSVAVSASDAHPVEYILTTLCMGVHI